MAAEAAEQDLSEFLELSKPRRQECSMSTATAALSDEDRVKLKAAMAAPVVSHAAISKWLAVRGHKVAAHTVGRHRNRVCSCE